MRQLSVSTSPSLLQSFRALSASLSPRRHFQLAVLLALMVASALSEVLSLGAIVPFLAVLADPVRALQQPLVAWFVEAFGFTSAHDLRWKLTLLFSAAAIGAGALRILLIYATARFNYGVGHELSAEIYRRTLYQPYEVHVSRNSSQIIGSLAKVDAVVWVIFTMLGAVGAALSSVVIIAVLLMIDPTVAAAALIGFALIYGVASAVTRRRLEQNNRTVASAYDARVQSVQEGLGGIRDVLLDQAQRVFLRRFTDIDWPMRQAQASNQIIGPSPRFAVEALGMVLIALLAYSLAIRGDGLATAMPVLGALALSAQRLMPLLQQSYQGWVVVASNRQSIADVVHLLEQPVSEESRVVSGPIAFEREIVLHRVSFRYQAGLPTVLHDVDLRIPRGGRVGFIGTTGSGKSTLIDILMGLLEPTTGDVRIDGVALSATTRLSWQRHIAHVPQAIFLADASFAENIAFGVAPGAIDVERVRRAARGAQIAEFIEAGRDGYDALVGERGVRLSGGQRQRIGIARALYRDANVLVFDEATSALDTETESAVMQSIGLLGREITIVLIAHRLSTLRGCDAIYRVIDGRVTATDSAS